MFVAVYGTAPPKQGKPMRSIPLSARLPVAAFFVLLVGLLPGRLEAQGAVNHLYDKFQIGISAADAVISSDIQINNADGSLGTSVDLGDLGISKNAFAPAGGIAWRPGKRHQLQLNYLYISRSGEKTLVDTIDFADTSFAAGARVNTKFSAPTLGLAYRFAFMARENTEIGFQLGLGALFFDLGIDALAGATGGGGDTATVSYSASKSLTGPTAALGLYANFRLGNHWILGASAGAIGAKISNITASTWTGAVDAKYFFNDHWGAAAGWNINGIKVSSSGDGEGWIDLSGSIKYTYQVFRLGVLYALP
jgi:hypothetical protein